MSVFVPGHGLAVRRCADVVNAAPLGAGALRRVLREHGEDVEELSEDDVADLQRASATLRAIAEADSLDAVSARLNEVLARCRPPRLESHGGQSAWHVHVDRHDAGWGEWFLASSALALATAVTESQEPPLGVCSAHGCDDLYATRSRGRPRRFCSTTCSSRARAASRRARG